MDASSSTGDSSSGGGDSSSSSGADSSSSSGSGVTDVWTAAANMKGGYTGFEGVTGQVTFEQPNGEGNVTITAVLSGMAAGTYAIHVHTFGDISSSFPILGPTVGGHFNPFNSPHGCYPSDTRHAGDIGNLTLTGNATETVVLVRNLMTLNGADLSVRSIVGLSVVIHAGPDTCVQPTGNAGAWAVQGVIGINPSATGMTNRAVANPATAPVSAIGVMVPTSYGTGIAGIVQFVPGASSTRVVANFTGLQPNGTFALSVNEFGYNGDNGLDAGKVNASLGFVQSNAQGAAFVDASFSGIELSGTVNILGRSVVLYSTDEVTSNRVAVGIIGASGRAAPPETSSSSSSSSSSSGADSSSSPSSTGPADSSSGASGASGSSGASSSSDASSSGESGSSGASGSSGDASSGATGSSGSGSSGASGVASSSSGPAPAPGEKAVEVTTHFNLELSDITTSFRTAFSTAVCATFGAPASRCPITSVRSGGVFIKFLILPGTGPSVSAAKDAFMAEFTNPASSLRMGTTFAAVDSSFMPTADTTSLCDDGNYRTDCDDSSDSGSSGLSTGIIIVIIACVCIGVVLAIVLIRRFCWTKNHRHSGFDDVEMQYDDDVRKGSTGSSFAHDGGLSKHQSHIASAFEAVHEDEPLHPISHRASIV